MEPDKSNHGASEKNKTPDPNSQYISYQTNKIPWWIHLMWFSFAVWGIIYLLLYALKDFIRWW